MECRYKRASFLVYIVLILISVSVEALRIPSTYHYSKIIHKHESNVDVEKSNADIGVPSICGIGRGAKDNVQDTDISPECPILYQTNKSRRQFIVQQLLATTMFPSITNAITTTANDNGYYSLRNNNNIQSPYIQKKQQERADRKKRASFLTKTKRWSPFTNVNKWNSVETCLLEMLPVRNPVFRQLQSLIEELGICSSNDLEGWKETLLDTIDILSYLESKRPLLEPIFNQEDPTELFISKSTLGESNIEELRLQLEALIDIASGDIDINIDTPTSDTVNSDKGRSKRGRRRPSNNIKKKKKNDPLDYIDMGMAGDIDVDAFTDTKRQTLLVLSELGELLVPSFPYAVPTKGKFGNLPRLLGRCTVTFSFERPSSASKANGLNFDFVGDNDKRFLGNITIIADGYLAPITAGNFVDLSARNFYTGLPVKAFRKNLGVVPSMSENTVVNDFNYIKARTLEISEGVLSKTTTKEKSGLIGSMFKSENDVLWNNENQQTTDAVLPILGSFQQEGFYDPLTAKPRRIPLEIVTLDSTSTAGSTLTYSSTYAALDDDMVVEAGRTTTTAYSEITSSSSAQRSFSSATSQASTNTTADISSTINPVLSFNIPDLVCLNHPDTLSNGGSSEFFALPQRDEERNIKRAKLLDGQYAPFGYIISGEDVYSSLRPGDIIKQTDVSDVGLKNLVKIRNNALEKEEALSPPIVEEEEDNTADDNT